MGRPKQSQIPELAQEWASTAQRLHPGWPVHSAIREEDYIKYGLLPGYVCIGQFKSNWTREPNRCGSIMVIVWDQEKNPIDDGITLPLVSENSGIEWRRTSTIEVH